MGKKRGSPIRRSSQKGSLSSEVPKGLKLLAAYAFVLAIFYLFNALVGFYSTALFLSSSPALINLAIMLLTIVVSAAIYKKEPWAYQATLIWLMVSILVSIASIDLQSFREFQAIRMLLTLIAFATIAIDLFLLQYVKKKKEYFLGKPLLKYDRYDRQLITVLSVFWIAFTLMTALIAGLFYIHTTQLADTVIGELKGTGMVHGIVICDEKQGQEQDVCFTVLASIYQKQDSQALCARIKSDFFRFTCSRM